MRLSLHSLPTRRSSDLREDHLMGMPADADFGQDLAVGGEKAHVAGSLLDGYVGGIERRRGSERSPKQAGISHLNRSEEHTSELQSRREIVCRLLLEKKN